MSTLDNTKLKNQVRVWVCQLNKAGFKKTAKMTGALYVFGMIYQIYPDGVTPKRPSDMLNALVATTVHAKGVLLGQAPYPNRNFANGLAFSIKEEALKSEHLGAKQKPSIKKIMPHMNWHTSDLTQLAQDGLLLLNTRLLHLKSWVTSSKTDPDFLLSRRSKRTQRWIDEIYQTDIVRLINLTGNDSDSKLQDAYRTLSAEFTKSILQEVMYDAKAQHRHCTY
jgi:uracil DNA glycosylase